MTPEQLAKSQTESAQQIALFAWAALSVGMYPQLKYLHHIPNGGSRGDTAQSRAIAGGKMKAEGVRKGVPDICLPWPSNGFHGLYIEMKAPKQKPVKGGKGGLSDEQIEWLNYLHSVGYKCAVCYSFKEAKAEIESYLL